MPKPPSLKTKEAQTFLNDVIEVLNITEPDDIGILQMALSKVEQRSEANGVTWVLGRMTHTCPSCMKVLVMNDDAWRNHTRLHVRIIELGGGDA